MSHSSDRASQNSTKQNLPTSRIFTPEEVEWQAVVVDDNTQQYYRDHPPEESAPDITTLLGVDDIPAELCARSQWVVWRYVEVDGRPTKKPFRVAKPLVGADSTNPREWGSFDAACALFNSNERLAQARRGAAGLGYVFAPDDPYAGVDLDKVIEEGELHPGASRIVEELDSYTEVSPSGTGLHVIVRGALQEGARNRTSSTPWGGEIEVYDRARFFCFTGKLWPTAPPTINGRHGELDALHTRFFPVKAKAERATYTPPTVSASRSDHEIITLASAAKNGAEFTALWPGPHVEGRASENDLSLCNHLAFWCGPDPDRIDGLFRQSGLMRDKWDEGRGATTYGRLTIDKALEGRTEFYEARPEVSADWRMGGESKGDAPGEEPNEEAAGEGGGPAAGAAAVTPLVAIGAGVKTLGQLAAEGAKDVDWRWHGYLASEAITLLGSKPKVGKSTLLFGLLGALERGALFVGLPTQRTRVLYVSEETGSQLQRKADKFGLDDDWHYVLPRAATFGHEWEKVAEAAGQLALERDCGVVVFDTFGGLARLGGDDENKAGRMMTALEPLHGIKVLGLAVLLSAHQRKSEGDHGDTIRGSNALPGDVDIIATLSRPGGDTHTSARILNAEGRYDETPERRHIALDQATNTYTTTGPPVVVKKQQREEEDVAILARLGTATATQFAKVAGCTDKTAKRRLDALVTGGRATCSGDGTRQSPTSYALTGGRSGQGSGQDALFGDGDPDRHHPL